MFSKLSQDNIAIAKRLINQSIESIDKDEIPFFDKVDTAFNNVLEKLSILNIMCDEKDLEEIKSLIKEHINISITPTSIFDDEYTPWLNNVRNEINWNHKNLYYEYLIDKKGWSTKTVYKSIDESTDVILDHLGNPNENRLFNKKGLVIGNVQSGKTANYTALINKCFDVGYKLVIVLAGTQNDLRAQTQGRLDYEVLGYSTVTTSSFNAGEKIGVGKLLGYRPDIDAITTKDNDFKKMSLIKPLGGNVVPILGVVKKNVSVLENLYNFLNREISIESTGGKLGIPICIIDDEVDQASVSTKKPDPETDPTKINGWIRKIIKLCSKVSYVGYTATPYANILIDKKTEHDIFGEDLYPKDFVVVLPSSNDYCGAEEFFGSGQDIDDELIRYVEDSKDFSDEVEIDEYGVPKFDASSIITNIPNSLKDAVADFIIASAVRRSRKGQTHNGMIIHVAAYKNASTSLKFLLDEYVDELKNTYSFMNNEIVPYLKNRWEAEFKNTSISRGQNDNWEDIEKELDNVFRLLKTKLLNGDSKDYINYSDNTESEIIVIGGNKLSRGITIEGLMISYYLRDPKAYDTAMQMGRWFGYKKSYLDLCRIYSINELIGIFVHICDADKILRTDICDMNNKKVSPKDYGLKILSHEKVLPTARNKMRSGLTLDISFKEQRVEITKFNVEKNINNFKLVENFIDKLKHQKEIDKTEELVFRNVGSRDVINYFLKDFNASEEDSYKIKKWINYIERLNNDKELLNWTVVLSDNSKSKIEPINICGYSIRKQNRKSFSLNGDYVRAVSSPEDFQYFFKKDDPNRGIYKQYKKSEDCRRLFNNKNAVLAIYVIDVKENEKVLHENIISMCIWFPYTNNVMANVEYIVDETFATKRMGEYLNE